MKPTVSVIGHSERRHQLCETQELITKRAEGVLKQQLNLVYCIGETLEENQSGKTFSVLKNQLDPVLKLCKSNNTDNLIIAYEPVWAIGTGEVATPEQIQSISTEIINHLKEYNIETPLLYGGSVKPENYSEIISLSAVDGALVGGASLQAEPFLALYEISNNS